MIEETSRIRAFNDALRQDLVGGKVVLTAGIATLPADVRTAILQRVRVFTAFSEDNDPHGEPDMRAGSACPDNPAETLRVLTIMLAEEC